MKHYISVDMEGISGIANWNEMEKDVPRVNELMTNEVNAVIEGILSVNPHAEKILVCDSHDRGQNILPEKLNKKAILVRGTPRKNYMMVGIEEEFDLSYYIGYHSSAGTIAGAMDHTFSGATIREVRINDKMVGEFELNAGYAGAYGVCPALVSGDEAFCKEVECLNLGTLTVTTKIANTRFCATLFHPEVVHDELKKMAAQVVKLGPSAFKPVLFQTPYTMTVDFANSAKADMACLIPSVKRLTGTKVEFKTETYPDLYNMFEAVTVLAQSVR